MPLVCCPTPRTCVHAMHATKRLRVCVCWTCICVGTSAGGQEPSFLVYHGRVHQGTGETGRDCLPWWGGRVSDSIKRWLLCFLYYSTGLFAGGHRGPVLRADLKMSLFLPFFAGATLRSCATRHDVSSARLGLLWPT